MCGKVLLFQALRYVMNFIRTARLRLPVVSLLTLGRSIIRLKYPVTLELKVAEARPGSIGLYRKISYRTADIDMSVSYRQFGYRYFSIYRCIGGDFRYRYKMIFFRS
jgi:hypothetical protein